MIATTGRMPTSCVRATTRGRMHLVRHDAGRLSLTLTGALTAEDAQVLADWLDQVLPTCEDAVIAVDTEGLSSYASSVRTLAQRVLKEHRARWTVMHALVRSQLVAMSVSVAKVLLGDIEIHADRVAFDRAVAGS